MLLASASWTAGPISSRVWALAPKPPLGQGGADSVCADWLAVRTVRSEPVSEGWAPNSLLNREKQGILTYLASLAEFFAESIRQISGLATNSLRIGTGNLIGVSGNFRGGTGNLGPDHQAERISVSERDTKRLLDLLENPPKPTEKLIRAARAR